MIAPANLAYWLNALQEETRFILKKKRLSGFFLGE